MSRGFSLRSGFIRLITVRWWRMCAIILSIVLELVWNIIFKSDWPFLSGNNQNIIEEKQVVAPVAERPPDAVLLWGDGQLAALLQPPRRGYQRERLWGRNVHHTSSAMFTAAPVLHQVFTLKLTADLPWFYQNPAVSGWCTSAPSAPFASLHHCSYWPTVEILVPPMMIMPSIIIKSLYNPKELCIAQMFFLPCW